MHCVKRSNPDLHTLENTPRRAGATLRWLARTWLRPPRLLHPVASIGAAVPGARRSKRHGRG